MASSLAASSVFELARSQQTGSCQAFDNIFRVQAGQAACQVNSDLSKRFGLAEQNIQTVVSVTNKVSLQQTWFNAVRKNKPQTFKAMDQQSHDATAAGKNCDFCAWEHSTADDHFGRVESQHAVTASNLFKYCEPCHGLVLFKHHDPLAFSQQQLGELLDVSDTWVQRAGHAHPHAHHPFFLWNCLHRAGASQYHGHAQVMLSSVPFPAELQAQQAAAAYQQAYPGRALHEDILTAHKHVGLLRQSGHDSSRSCIYANVSPAKDMELVVTGQKLACKTFQSMMFAALRALIDHLGVATFNAAILGIRPPYSQSHPQSPPFPGVQARIASRGNLSSKASDYGGLEVFGGASIGHTDPFDVIAAVDQQLAAFPPNK
ncbi:hypothetical protein WJX74_005673 [Apatococcus lobatus]|uniref:Uncharacterized protein n=2 Tax=Apatococcus TaxID=904362 RepID=A0AAW1TA44_9CHLO